MPRDWEKLRNKLAAAIIAYSGAFVFIQPVQAQEPASVAQPAGATAATPASESPEQKALKLAEASRRLSLELEGRVSALVARHIPAAEFQVIVNAKAPETLQDQLPYFPGSSGLGALGTAGTAAAGPTDIKITVFLAQRFGKETTVSLERIMKEKLADLGDKNFAITFEKITVKTEPADSDIQRRLEKAEADLRSASSTSQTVERERNDIKSELTATKTNFDNMIKGEQDKAKAAEEKAKALEESKESLKNLAQSGVWVLVAILLGVCLIFASRLFAAAIKTVGNGISTIAGSLENLANSMGQKPEESATEEKEEVSQEEPVAAAGGVGGSGTTATLESLRARAFDLNKELLATINENNESIVLKYLSGLLGHPDTVDIAVATMEVLGKEKANQMFYRLGREFQEQIMNFLNHGHYRKNKIELMVDGGEQLMTRMMGESFKATRGALTPEMTELLLQLSTTDLADVVNTIDMNHRLRLFFYLEPTRLADILSVIGKTMPTELEEIGSNLHRIAEFEKSVEFDQALIQAMRQRLDANQQDQMEPYMKYYQEVLETMDESMVESILSKLSAVDERLRKHLQANIVTLNTYFGLQAEFQKELLEGFGNKAIATLMAGVEKEQGEVFLKYIEERRHSLIQEEIDGMESQPKREIRANFDKVKATLLARMKILAKSGALAEAVQPASASTQQPTAA